jgi:membrane protease YdiL (CAAX protease family)
MYKYSIPRRIWRIIYPPLLIIAIIGFVVILFAILGFEMTGDNVMLTTQLISVAVFYLLWKKEKSQSAFSGGTAVPLTAILTIIISIALNIVVVMLLVLSNTSGIENNDGTSSNNFFALLLYVGILGPIAEELCFRGIVLNRLADCRIWVAILIQAVLFSLLHIGSVQMLYSLFVGAFFGFIYARFRTLLLPIIAHIAYNSINIILSKIFEVLNAEYEPLTMLIPAAAVVAITMVLLLRQNFAEKQKENS